MQEKLFTEFSFQRNHINNVIDLHLSGNTVPFIARYRKEMTGNMDAEDIRNIIERYEYLENLEKRKQEVIEAIDERGKLTDELKKSIMKAETMKEVEDLYAPYKSKKKTKADLAREAGLEPLAVYIRANADLGGLSAEAEKFVCDAVPDADTAVSMASDIVTEEIGHDPEIKARLRELYELNGEISSIQKTDSKERNPYEDYYDFRQKMRDVPPHRVLAMFRGEREKILKLKIEIDEDMCLNAIAKICAGKGMEDNEITKKSMRQAFKKMLELSLELEFRGELKEKGEIKAISVFAENLKNLLLTPTVRNRVIMGIDPAFRTGCKFAVVDTTGDLLDYGVMYPTKPQADYQKSRSIMLESIRKNSVNAIAIGNGTASRETEEFVASVISEDELDIQYTIVSEAGASVYSAGAVAKREFPELDVSIRGAISIARRVLDPLAELVKIDPKSIGVGMYQHDVTGKKLEKSLTDVVEDVVNNVGVDLNTASPSLLSYVSGLSDSLAEKIVKHRQSIGRFKSRKELMKVDGVGELTFRQSAGFLKVYGGGEKLDSMFIHPESYDAVYAFLEAVNLSSDKCELVKLAVKDKNVKSLAEKLGIGEFTIKDIIDNLEKPDRDIRDNVDPVVFKQGILSIESLKEGDVLTGKVSNVVDFGAFVDVGLKNDGLVHISQLADRFVSDPSEVVKVGQTVKTKVLSVDRERGRLSLSMKV
ncbi:Tex-like protein protein-like protein [Denitrovibrio acetiphilus DSM 12809]|uniref:Tex-like protein protein-like protein n=1 Tax=Denitrovibrio acetiphilus (strain DSM 12809 / NBRC 114555 / N2460) TaxID=522772 RepID=D4H0R8_DENA2|nr:Tex family protein [Denitrovibrio acetiphilus]ADD68581.1 Tex-like protein protein-like protein [Denitrovibrio acetiphilus DSM 12809]